MGKNKKLEERKKRIASETSILKKKGYAKHDVSITAAKANLLGMFIPMPLMAVLIVVFGQLCGWNSFVEGYDAFVDSPSQLIIFIAAFIISTIVHELIHGLFFGLTARSHFKTVEFGIFWKSLTPYCCCTEAVSKPRYLLAVLAPGFILGLCTSVVGIAIGNMSLLIFGIANLSLAGGDMCIALEILKFSKKGRKELYLDHPEKPGSIAFIKTR